MKSIKINFTQEKDRGLYECGASKIGHCVQLAVHCAVVFDLIYPKSLYPATEG